MPPFTLYSDKSHSNQFPYLQRLLVLRSAVLGCVIATSLITKLALSVELHLLATFAVVAVAALFTFCSYLYYRSKTAHISNALLIQLVFDALLVAALAYIAGRSANPFIYYWLVLVAISATVFSIFLSALYTAGCILLYTALMLVDINAHTQHMTPGFRLHLVGMWVNFVGSALLVTFFVSRLAQAVRDRQSLLAKAREETLKNEQLVGIGTLAASTVHALGTPLSTLAMLLEELEDDIGTEEHNDTLDTMHAQIDRCKSTLGRLSSLADQQNNNAAAKPIESIAKELEDHYRVIGATPMPEFIVNDKVQSHPAPYNLLLNHALINLIDNSVSAAKSIVAVTFSINQHLLEIAIMDDGDGIPDIVIEHWGEPLQSQKDKGLGIGVFLANSTIEKMGGAIELRQAPGSTKIVVTLPLKNNL